MANGISLFRNPGQREGQASMLWPQCSDFVRHSEDESQKENVTDRGQMIAMLNHPENGHRESLDAERVHALRVLELFFVRIKYRIRCNRLLARAALFRATTAREWSYSNTCSSSRKTVYQMALGFHPASQTFPLTNRLITYRDNERDKWTVFRSILRLFARRCSPASDAASTA